MNTDAQAISPTMQELLLCLAAWGCIAIVVGPILYFLWRSGPRQRVWPPQRQRLVTWSMIDFALILLLAELTLPLLFSSLVMTWFPFKGYAQAEVAATVAQAGSTLTSGGPPAASWLVNHRIDFLQLKAMTARFGLYVLSICAPFQVLLIVGVLRLRAQALPLQIGLSIHRWRADLLTGFLVWLVVAPLCFALHWVLQLPYLQELIGPTTPHALGYLIQLGPSSAEWVLLMFLTVVAGPVVEECFVRGALQPLMVKNPLLADATIITGLLTAISLGLLREDGTGTPWLPMLFLVTVGLGYLFFEWIMHPWLPRPGAARAIFASSLFFAALHFEAWPTPIPLFFLSLGLGFVAYRTQSLWGAILLHALFNLLNFVALGLTRWLT